MSWTFHVIYNHYPEEKEMLNADFEAYNVRNQFRKYFYSREGQVAWQLAHVERVNWKKEKWKLYLV